MLQREISVAHQLTLAGKLILGDPGGRNVTTRVTGSDEGDWRLSVSSTAAKAGPVTAGLELEKGAVGHRLQADPRFYGGHEGHSSLGPLERTWPAISLISVP